MNTLFGRRVSALSERRDRMESELTRWLVGLEPVGTPVALRIRTFSDLRAEAARPRRRLPWLRPALSSMAALGSVVAGAGLLPYSWRESPAKWKTSVSTASEVNSGSRS